MQIRMIPRLRATTVIKDSTAVIEGWSEALSGESEAPPEDWSLEFEMVSSVVVRVVWDWSTDVWSVVSNLV